MTSIPPQPQAGPSTDKKPEINESKDAKKEDVDMSMPPPPNPPAILDQEVKALSTSLQVGMLGFRIVYYSY
jgi:hypothetical protein